MSTNGKPLASLSLDLDNQWSYTKTHGDPAWEALPSYLDLVVPRALRFLDERGLKITFFIVGQDAARPENRSTAILEATGQRPTGFRGPGFSLSTAVLTTLKRRGYRYDASTVPTFLGPLARAYYFFSPRGWTRRSASSARNCSAAFARVSGRCAPTVGGWAAGRCWKCR